MLALIKPLVLTSLKSDKFKKFVVDLYRLVYYIGGKNVLELVVGVFFLFDYLERKAFVILGRMVL